MLAVRCLDLRNGKIVLSIRPVQEIDNKDKVKGGEVIPRDLTGLLGNPRP